MKSILLLTTIVLTSISCSRKINLTDHYDPTLSFTVHEHTVAEPYEVQVDDAKHAKILSWLELNNENWKRTHNEWAGMVFVYQENFRLLLYRNSEYAVVIITDDKNKSRFYRRAFQNDGLKFLDQ